MMDSEEWFDLYGGIDISNMSASPFTVEELYQHFAERFRQENAACIPTKDGGVLDVGGTLYEIDTTT